jgi:hypothetical protein
MREQDFLSNKFLSMHTIRHVNFRYGYTNFGG